MAVAARGAYDGVCGYVAGCCVHACDVAVIHANASDGDAGVYGAAKALESLGKGLGGVEGVKVAVFLVESRAKEYVGVKDGGYVLCLGGG